MINIKNRFTAVCGAFFALAILLLLGACSQEPIFAAIEQEVKLKEAGVKNIVYSIVEFSGELYAANGKISSKPNAPGDWHGVSAPGFTIRLAVGNGGTDLYALTAHVTNIADLDNPEYSYAVWYRTASSSWSRVASITGTVRTICDNQAAGSDRAAYVVTTDGVYSLAGGSAGSAETANGANSSTVAAARFNNINYFSSSLGFAAGDKALYRMNGGTAQYSTDGSTWTDGSGVSVNGNKTIAAAVYDNRYLLVGTTSGARAIAIDGGGLLTGGTMELKDAGLGDNAASVLNNAYTFSGGIYVFGPNIFSAAVHPTIPARNGLWGYYGSHWDRE